jgi:hypothetical protein
MKLVARSSIVRVATALVASLAIAGCGGSSSDSATTSTDEALNDDGVKTSLTIVPATVHLTAGGPAVTFTLESTGLKNGDTIDFDGPPDGIEEDTSVFIEHGKDAISVWADENTKAFTGSQTFSVSYYSSTKQNFVTLKAKVAIVVD